MGLLVGQVREMILRMEGQPTIDNLQNYPVEIVDQLRKLLVDGVSARQDPRRNNFYDVEHAVRTFFRPRLAVERKGYLARTMGTGQTLVAA